MRSPIDTPAPEPHDARALRFLHTSDWHLGRSFGGASLLDEQAAFADEFVALVAAERADLVVLAGDVYDRAVPPADAVALFRKTLQRVRETGARVVVIAGNHDGADRVAAYDGLTDLAGVYVRGGYERAADVIALTFEDGPLDVVAVPFLDPLLARPTDDADAPRPTHASVLAAVLDAARSRCTAPRSLAVAHAFVAGAAASDSERALSVGGTDQVPVSLFDGFSYTALGHLHRPQTVGARVHYPGSPLPYSFSEAHPKRVLAVDMDAAGAITVRALAVTAGRPVVTLTGTLDDLLRDPSHAPFVAHRVRAIVTDPGVVVDAKARLRERFAHIVEIELRPERADGTSGPIEGSAAARRGLGPMASATAFWRDVVGDEPTAEERSVIRAALAHAGAMEDAS